jgi:hypothetical protein
MAKTTPTQRSLAILKLVHPLVQVVEKWNPHARIRQDLFGIIDILCISAEGETIAVQTTSGSGVAARITKMTDSPALPHLRKAGWRIIVHGWRKNAAGRWTLREVDLS